jgi:hypothetical protein
VIEQRISQISGVGEVLVVGASLPAVRIELNPNQLASYGISLPAVQQVVAGQNSNSGQRASSPTAMSTADIVANDQISKAADYKPLVVGYHNGGAVRLQDVADVIDSQQTVRQAGFLNGKPSVNMIIFRQPGANIITTVDAVKAAIPSLQATIPRGEHLITILDRTLTIRASVSDIERTLIISVVLVIAGGLPFSAQRPCDVHSGRGGSGVADRNLRGHVSVRLLARQPVADGAGDRERLRGGRRHRGDGEHHAPSGSGHDAHQAALLGAREEIGFTVFLDQRFADRRIHSAASDGRHHRAPVPRVRHYAFRRDSGVDGGLADHHAHDVLARAGPEKISSTAGSTTGASASSTVVLGGYRAA